MDIFPSWKILPPSTFLWSLHGDFDPGRHQSTFHSRFNNLFLSIRELVFYVNTVFSRLIRQILNNASKQLG